MCFNSSVMVKMAMSSLICNCEILSLCTVLTRCPDKIVNKVETLYDNILGDTYLLVKVLKNLSLWKCPK